MSALAAFGLYVSLVGSRGGPDVASGLVQSLQTLNTTFGAHVGPNPAIGTHIHILLSNGPKEGREVAHLSVLPPSTTMISSSSGAYMARSWRSKTPMQRSSFSAWNPQHQTQESIAAGVQGYAAMEYTSAHNAVCLIPWQTHGISSRLPCSHSASL